MLSRYYRVNADENSRGHPKGLVIVDSRSDPDKLLFGVSYCSDNDMFNKRVARNIAEGRLRSGKYFVPKNFGENDIRNSLKNNPGFEDLIPFINETLSFCNKD